MRGGEVAASGRLRERRNEFQVSGFVRSEVKPAKKALFIGISPRSSLSQEPEGEEVTIAYEM